MPPADDTSVGEQEEEEIVELSEEDLLQLLDNQEPALQVCSRLFHEGWDKHARFSCLNQDQISDLQHRGFIIKDECLAETVCEQLHATAVQLHSAGNMEKATKVGLMPDMPLDKFTDVSARGDSITWLHEGNISGPGGSAGLQAMQLLQEVQADLHSIMRLEKRSAEYQLAVYVGGGSQYVKHRDALPDDGADPNQRRVTAILYANPDWRPANGGQLRIWLPPAASSPSASPPPGRTNEPQQTALELPDGQHLSAATVSASPQANGKTAGQQHATECQEALHSAQSNYRVAAPAQLLAEQELCDRRSTASDCLQAPKEAALWRGHLQGDADSHCQCDNAVSGLSDRLQGVKLQKISHPGAPTSIHIQDVNGERVLDIAPVSGRLVVFLSGAIDHAVLPSHNPRVALTAWCQ